MNRRRVLSVALLGLLLLGGLPSFATDEPGTPPPTWDPAMAKRLSAELVSVLEKARLRGADAAPQQTVLQQRQRDAAEGSIRRMLEAAQAFDQRMRDGADRAESEVYYRALVEQVRTTLATAGDAVPAPGVQPLLDRMDEILEKLRRMYAAP